MQVDDYLHSLSILAQHLPNYQGTLELEHVRHLRWPDPSLQSINPFHTPRSSPSSASLIPALFFGSNSFSPLFLELANEFVVAACGNQALIGEIDEALEVLCPTNWFSTT